ncbi:MAG: ScpA family protein [Vulcanimicrobiota bacterium]
MFKKPQGPSTGYRVQLPAFEGPLDLLLHLVDHAKLEITEISLAAVAGQYQQYLETLQDLDIEIESSYLVVFAQLLEIKSRALLPEPPPLSAEEMGEEASEEEPNDLVERLREYKLMKQISDILGERELRSLARYPHPCELPEFDMPALDVSLNSLHAASLRLLKPKGEPFKPAPTFKKIEISVPERMAQIWNWLSGKPKAFFRQLLGGNPSKGLIVVTFLAVLELARRGRVTLHQESYQEDIEIEHKESA